MGVGAYDHEFGHGKMDQKANSSLSTSLVTTSVLAWP